MFKRLTLRNFQGHAKLDIEFKPGVNCIVGSSDSGKSAVVRALSLVTRNRPSGDSFVRWGKAKASVTLHVGKHVVARERGKRVNVYKINERELKAFGAGVPEDVHTLTRMEDINFQMQHDAPYWFGQSDGEVARQLNAIVNLSIVDKTLASIGGQVKTVRTELEFVRGQVLTLRDKVKASKQAKRADVLLTEAEKAEAVVTATRERAAHLRSMISELSALRKRKDSFAAFLGAAEPAIQSGKALAGTRESKQALAERIESLAHWNTLRKLQVPDMGPLYKQLDALKRLRSQIQEVRRYCADLTQEHGARAAYASELEKAKEELRANTPAVCPTCKQPMPHVH